MEATKKKEEVQEMEVPITSMTVWVLLEPHLPGKRGRWGGIAQDSSAFTVWLWLNRLKRVSLEREDSEMRSLRKLRVGILQK